VLLIIRAAKNIRASSSRLWHKWLYHMEVSRTPVLSPSTQIRTSNMGSSNMGSSTVPRQCFRQQQACQKLLQQVLRLQRRKLLAAQSNK
jgi:hypothetical protein